MSGCGSRLSGPGRPVNKSYQNKRPSCAASPGALEEAQPPLQVQHTRAQAPGAVVVEVPHGARLPFGSFLLPHLVCVTLMLASPLHRGGRIRHARAQLRDVRVAVCLALCVPRFYPVVPRGRAPRWFGGCRAPVWVARRRPCALTERPKGAARGRLSLVHGPPVVGPSATTPRRGEGFWWSDVQTGLSSPLSASREIVEFVRRQQVSLHCAAASFGGCLNRPKARRGAPGSVQHPQIEVHPDHADDVQPQMQVVSRVGQH